jgi:hypothetical protein
MRVDLLRSELAGFSGGNMRLFTWKARRVVLFTVWMLGAGAAARAQVTGTLTASGSFLPFERSFFTAVLTNNGPNDVAGVSSEYIHIFQRDVRVDRATATIGTVTVSVEGDFSTFVRWDGTLCGTQSTCPRSVTIVSEVFPEYAAQGRSVGTQGSLFFGGNTTFTNGAQSTVGILPNFPTAPMLSGAGSVTLAKFCGANPFERVGSILASGDFDGDGFDDLVIGLPRRTAASTLGNGAVCVLYGGAQPFAANSVRIQFLHHGLPGFPGSPQTDGGFGESLATGDFNGDGFSDLAVGASFYNVGRAVDSGAVWVFPGSGQGLTTIGSRMIDQSGLPSEAVEPGDRFGFALAAGDVDADGLDDLVVGVPFEDLGSGANQISDAGMVRVFHSLGTGNPLSRNAAIVGSGPRFRLGIFLRDETPEANDRYGFRVAAGDLAGSPEAAEIVASSPFETIGTIPSGVVEVHAMDAAGAITLVHAESPCDRGECFNDPRFGDRLAVANVNGDLRPDLIVSDRRSVAGSPSAGVVTVLGAIPPRAGSYLAPFVLHQDAPGAAPGVPGDSDLFGFALATGDFNGDGIIDLAAGVPAENAGATNDAGFVNVFSSPWSSTRSQGLQGFDQTALGDVRETDDEFGTALVSGDFNGDGYDDLAIGAPGEEVAGGPTDQGVVQVIFGGGGN